MKIGIIISVSEYDNASDLPGCKNDAMAMKQTLNAAKKYDHILVFSERVESSKVKDDLVQFIVKYEKEEVEEVFFYFSGHGYFMNNEFYYIMSNYEPNKINSTCLQNSELDNYFKNLNPKLFIKVIDACQSGSQYIKDIKPLEFYFQSTKNEFDKCYFMNSCQNSQSSFATETISDFTLAFLESLIEVEEDSIRYKNIIDFISDKFQSNPAQNPLFVVQAQYIEEFCSNTKEFKHSIKKILAVVKSSRKGEPEHQDLIDLIVEESKMYTTLDEGLEVLRLIKSKFESAQPIEELLELYETKVSEIETFKSLPSESTIAEFLHKLETDFFAKSQYETKWVENPTFSSSAFGLSQRWMETHQSPGQLVNTYSGFEHTFNAPYKGLTLDYIRKFQNIENFNCTITYFINSTHIKLIYTFEKYNSKNWTEFEHTDSVNYFHEDSELKDKSRIELKLENIISDFNHFVLNELKRDYGLIEDGQAEEINEEDAENQKSES